MSALMDRAREIIEHVFPATTDLESRHDEIENTLCDYTGWADDMVIVMREGLNDLEDELMADKVDISHAIESVRALMDALQDQAGKGQEMETRVMRALNDARNSADELLNN